MIDRSAPVPALLLVALTAGTGPVEESGTLSRPHALTGGQSMALTALRGRPAKN
jgi:hypothetical protein